MGFAPVIKWQLTTEKLIGHDASSPDVRAWIHLTAHDLRCHEPVVREATKQCQLHTPTQVYASTLQCSKPVTIESVVCHVNPEYGGMTYAAHQQCSFMLWTLLCVRIPAMLMVGLLPQLKTESAPLHDSKSIARVARWPQVYSATHCDAYENQQAQHHSQSCSMSFHSAAGTLTSLTPHVMLP